ncbi:hypothetical protein AOLI_G00088760 [Acnodon oligacanthus]
MPGTGDRKRGTSELPLRERADGPSRQRERCFRQHLQLSCFAAGERQLFSISQETSLQGRLGKALPRREAELCCACAGFVGQGLAFLQGCHGYIPELPCPEPPPQPALALQKPWLRVGMADQFQLNLTENRLLWSKLRQGTR